MHKRTEIFFDKAVFHVLYSSDLPITVSDNQ